MTVYGVILTVIIGVLFGYRFVGSITYQVRKRPWNHSQVVKWVKYLQKYHFKTGRRRLFKTIAADPNQRKKAWAWRAVLRVGCRTRRRSGA